MIHSFCIIQTNVSLSQIIDVYTPMLRTILEDACLISKKNRQHSTILWLITVCEAIEYDQQTDGLNMINQHHKLYQSL